MFKVSSLIFCLVLVAPAKPLVSRWQGNAGKVAKLRNDKDYKIVGGDEVIPHSLPFLVSLQNSYGNAHFCGAAILSADFIVTAAHCCEGQNATELQIVAGDHDLTTDEGTEQVVKVSEIHIHPRYSPVSISNDICLLELMTPLELNRNVDAAILPYPHESFTGTANVTGWGVLSPGGSTLSTLHSVRIPLFTDEECREVYGPLGIDDSNMCAGDRGKDFCLGDSGGPLTCGGVLCGIVSWSLGCAVNGYPGVYAEMSYFLDFINDYVYKKE